MRKRLIIFLTFIGGLYFFFEFVLPEKIPTPPDRSFDRAMVQLGGTKQTDDWYSFPNTASATAAAAKLGSPISLPESVLSRPALLMRTKNGVVLEFNAAAADTLDKLLGWRQRDDRWQIFKKTDPIPSEKIIASYGALDTMGGKIEADGWWHLKDAKLAAAAAEKLGVTTPIPSPIDDRPAALTQTKDGVFIEFRNSPDDMIRGVIDWTRRGDKWRITRDTPPLSFGRVAGIFGGAGTPDGAFAFKNPASLSNLAADLGAKLDVPKEFEARVLTVSPSQDGEMFARTGFTVTAEVAAEDKPAVEGWNLEKPKWSKTFQAPHGFDDIVQVSDAQGSAPDFSSGKFHSKNANKLLPLIDELGVKIVLPQAFQDRSAWVERLENMLVFSVKSETGDDAEKFKKDGWVEEKDEIKKTPVWLKSYEAPANAGSGTTKFQLLSNALFALRQLGVDVALPDSLLKRRVWIEAKGKALTVSIEREKTDATTLLDGWEQNERNTTEEKSTKPDVWKKSFVLSEFAGKGKFHFEKVAPTLVNACEAFALDVKFPDTFNERSAWLKREKKSLVVAVESVPEDDKQTLRGWELKDGYWMRSFNERKRLMYLKGDAIAVGAQLDEVNEKQSYTFSKAETAAKLLSDFGINEQGKRSSPVELPPAFASRAARVTQKDQGEIVFEVEHMGDDVAMEGWSSSPARWAKHYTTYSYFVLGAYHEKFSEVLIIIGSMAVGLGLINILRGHGTNLLMRRKNWINSAGLIAAMLGMMTLGFWSWANEASKEDGFGISFISGKVGHFYNDAMIHPTGFLVGLGSAMFSLLAVYIAAAAYRAFRVKSGEAALMMLTALLVMMGQTPLGVTLMDPLFKLFFKGGISEARGWLLTYINAAAVRAIAFGAGVAGLAMAVRMWFSMEAGSFYKEKEK